MSFPVGNLPPDSVKAYLGNSPGFLNYLINGVADPIFVKDRQHRWLLLNDAFCQFIGYDSSELIGKSEFEFFPEAEAQGFWEKDEQVFVSGMTIENEECFTDATGTTKFISTKRSVFKDSHGNEFLVGTIRDITQRKQVEQELQRSQQLLQLVMDNIPQAIFWKDLNSVFLGCNQSFAEMVGATSPQEIVGKTDYDLTWKQEEAERLRVCDRQVMESDTAELNRIESWLTPDQQQRWLEMAKIPLHDETGAVIGILGSITDITDRKQAEAALERLNQELEARVEERTTALRESEHRLQSILQNMPVMMDAFDDEGHIIMWNRECERVTGYSAAEIVGNPNAMELLYPDADYLKRMMAEWVKLGSNYRNWEWKLWCKDGSIKTVIWSNLSQQFPVPGWSEWGLGVDISDLKATEEALRASEAKNRALLEVIPDIIFRYSRDGIYLDFFPSLDWDALIPPEQFLGKTVFEVLPDTVAQQLYQAIQQALETQKIQLIHYQLTLESVVHDYEARVVACGDNEVLTIVRDISDRIRAEAALQESQQLLQLVMDNIPQAIFWKDRNLVYLGCNRAYAQDAGLTTPSEIVGLTDFDLWTPEEARAIQAFDRQVMESNTPTLRLVKPMPEIAGEVGWLEINKIPLHAADGSVVGVLGTYEDITERVRAEEVLRQSEQQMREQARREQLLNHLISQIRNSLDFDIILETTLQEVQNFLETDCCYFAWFHLQDTDAYWEVIKESRHKDSPSLLGRYAISRTGPLATRLQWLEPLAIEDEETWNHYPILEFVHCLSYKAVLMLPIQTQSGMIGVLSCAHHQNRHWDEDEIALLEAVVGQLAIALNQADLYAQTCAKAAELEQTLEELKRTQTQMIQSEKMSSLGQLVAGVAHEINNPVNFIYGNLNYANDYTQDLLRLLKLYQRHYAEPVPEIVAEAAAIDLEFLLEDLPKTLSSMKVGAERIQEIVASLRTFSRMDEAECKAVNIHEGIDSTLMILRNRLRATSNQNAIEVLKEYGELPQVECYAGQLNQVFMNILANAIDALRETAIAAPQILIRTEMLEGNWIRICITDNGPGIPETIQRRLFDPFFTTKPVGQGTGMGLSISYQIITERHGGRLECISQPGQGTTFQLEIPIQQSRKE
jgi:PAS domain S-box-containing protein